MSVLWALTAEGHSGRQARIVTTHSPFKLHYIVEKIKKHVLRDLRKLTCLCKALSMFSSSFCRLKGASHQPQPDGSSCNLPCKRTVTYQRRYDYSDLPVLIHFVAPWPSQPTHRGSMGSAIGMERTFYVTVSSRLANKSVQPKVA